MLRKHGAQASITRYHAYAQPVKHMLFSMLPNKLENGLLAVSCAFGLGFQTMKIHAVAPGAFWRGQLLDKCPPAGNGNGQTAVDAVLQDSLKDTCCPFETWLCPPKCRETTMYQAMFRCIMKGCLRWFSQLAVATIPFVCSSQKLSCSVAPSIFPFPFFGWLPHQKLASQEKVPFFPGSLNN